MNLQPAASNWAIRGRKRAGEGVRRALSWRQLGRRGAFPVRSAFAFARRCDGRGRRSFSCSCSSGERRRRNGLRLQAPRRRRKETARRIKRPSLEAAGDVRQQKLSGGSRRLLLSSSAAGAFGNKTAGEGGFFFERGPRLVQKASGGARPLRWSVRREERRTPTKSATRRPPIGGDCGGGGPVERARRGKRKGDARRAAKR